MYGRAGVVTVALAQEDGSGAWTCDVLSCCMPRAFWANRRRDCCGFNVESAAAKKVGSDVAQKKELCHVPP